MKVFSKLIKEKIILTIGDSAFVCYFIFNESKLYLIFNIKEFNIMKKIYLLLISLTILLTMFVQLNAQDGRINFSVYETGKYYKVTLANGMEVTGKLMKVDDLTIDIKTELKTLSLKKEDIVKISKSYSFVKSEKPDTNLKTIELKDGSEFIGHIRNQDSLSIKFETTSGTKIDIKRDQIENIEDQRPDFFIGDDPNKTRLFLAPTARNLKSGTGYFSVNELFFPVFAFGITDFLTLGGGMTILPGAETQLFYLNGKALVLHLERLDLSAGLLYTNLTSGNDNGLTVLYGNSTYGTREAAVTVGAGFTFDGNDNSGTYPLLILGGELKLSKSTKLISENWIPTSPESVKIYSLGVRFFGKKVAGDFGLMYPLGNDGESISGWPFIPWLGLSYNFDL